MKVRNWSLGLLLVAGLAVLAGCGSAEEEEAPAAPAPAAPAAPAPAAPAAPVPAAPAPAAGEQAKRGGTLRISTGPESQQTLDPHVTTWTSSGSLIAAMGDTLVARHPETYEFVPGGLATSWEVSDGGLTWTFNIREGVKYHDGEPFDAPAMVASYQRGAEKGIVPGIYLPPDGEYSAPDDMTFVIKSPLIYGPMLDHLSWPIFFVVTGEHHRAVVGEDEYGRDPMGTGAFKFKKWVLGDSITLVRNEEYDWGPEFLENQGAPYIDEIFVKFIAEEATINAALLSGELDVAYLPNQFAESLRKDDRFETFDRASGRLSGISFNHSRAPFNDVNVRRALMVGLDREKMLQAVDNGEGYPQYSALIRALPFYNQEFEDESAELLYFNPEKALGYLAKAGWVPGDDGRVRKDGEPMEITMIQTGSERNVRIGSMVQAQLRDLGITVNLETLETATHNARRNAGDWDLRHQGYGTLTADILSFFWHPQKSSNRDGMDDTVFGDRLDRARHSDGQERVDANLEVLKYFRDNAMHLALLNPNLNTLVNTRVQNIIVHRNSYDWLFNDAWIKE